MKFLRNPAWLAVIVSVLAIAVIYALYLKAPPRWVVTNDTKFLARAQENLRQGMFFRIVGRFLMTDGVMPPVFSAAIISL